MTPAGSGSGHFRGRRELRNTQPPRAISACKWMLPWLLPAGLLGTVALISLSGAFAYVLVALWGWVLFPCLAAFVNAHSRTDKSHEHGTGPDGEADYWRTKLM